MWVRDRKDTRSNGGRLLGQSFGKECGAHGGAPSGIDSATESCLSTGQPLWGQPTSNDYWGRSVKDWALWHIMEQCDRPLQVRSSPWGWPRLWGLRHSPAACSAQSSFFPELLMDIVPWHSLTNILCTNLYHRVSFLGNKICNNSVTHQ